MNARLRFLPAVLLLATLACGCGQRGDLYLRDNPPPGLKAPKPPAYTPVPYPKESTEDKGAGEPRK